MEPVQSPAAAPEQQIVVVPARFNERFIAYFLDTAPFALGYSGVVYFALDKLGGPAMARPLALGFVAAYVLYHFVGNLTGGTIGKRLMGLRVLRRDGQKLGVVGSLVRALGSCVSTPLANWGYLVALVHPENRAFHDLISGSVVIEPRRAPPAQAALMFLTAALMLCGLYFLMFWVNLYKPRPQDLEAMEDAKKGLMIMADIEESWRKDHGAYTDKLEDLAAASGDAVKFHQAMGELFDAKSGFKLLAGNRGYKIEGGAKDAWHKRFILSGPPPRVTPVK